MNNFLLPCPFFLTLLCIVLASSQIQQNDPLESFIVRDPLNPDNIRYQLPLPSLISQFPQQWPTVIQRREFSGKETNSPVFIPSSPSFGVSNSESEQNSAPSTSTLTSGNGRNFGKRIQWTAYDPHQQAFHVIRRKLDHVPRFPRCNTVGEMMEQWPVFTATLEDLLELPDPSLRQNEKYRFYNVAAAFHNLYTAMGKGQFNHEFGNIRPLPRPELLAFPLKMFALQKYSEWKIKPWGVKANGSGVDEWKQFLSQYQPRHLRNKARSRN